MPRRKNTSIDLPENNEDYFTVAKKYLKDKVMSKEEYLVRLTQIARSLKKDASATEKKFFLDACREISENSGWKRDNRQTADRVILNFAFDPSFQTKMKVAEKVEEELPKIKSKETINIKPLK